ncbi:hypothetical protein E7V67_024220 [[Empedobacter] haloabium]|uniref:Uncharacterized protein n=1 Tax=[Empedobacter] haloabium TaxID=592317 RepID=A0ABZ1UL26_9BURK
MARSIRVLYRNVHGRVRRNFNWPPIQERSAIIITAAEWAPGNPIPGDPSPGRPHLGEANVYVTNVGPHDPEGGSGGVEFHLHVDWPSPLDVIVTISVLEDVENFVVVG